jgi:thiosulfate/3-mercaptopyruvate sulfurtransferase
MLLRRPLRIISFPTPLVRNMSTTTSSLTSYLVTPRQLSKALTESSPAPIPISAAWFLPNDPQKRTGISSFQKSHIPNSRFFDLDKIADTSSPYPHMLPSPSLFSQHMRRLGINNTDDLVVYDAPETGLFSAPRVAWTFRVFGHKGGVHVLDNYKLWVEGGLPTESGEEKQWSETQYESPGLKEEPVVDFEEVRKLARQNESGGEGEVVILDARSKGRWAGSDPEPRKGLSSGHMPGSLSVPFTDVVDGTTKTMKSPEELRKLFHDLGVKGDKPIITTCGTGVTAAVIETALLQAGIGEGRRKVYDGSWTEWAQRADKEDGLIVKSSSS